MLLEWWILLLGSVNVSVSAHFHESSYCSFWNKDEWSANEESELFVQSLSFSLRCRIKVDNVPFLVEAIVLVINDNVLTFIILASKDINCLLVDRIQDLSSHELPNLVPVVGGLCSLSLKVLTRSVALDSNRLVVISRLDCSGDVVEVPHLRSSTVLGLNDNIGANKIEVSSCWKG